MNPFSAFRFSTSSTIVISALISMAQLPHPHISSVYATGRCQYIGHCKTYFAASLVSRFWNVEISLRFNLAFSQRFASIYQAFDHGQTEFSRVFNFPILSSFLAKLVKI